MGSGRPMGTADADADAETEPPTQSSEEPEQEAAMQAEDEEASKGTVPAEDHEALADERDELAARVEQLEEENEALTDRLARARADYANYKKRAVREKEEAARDARIEMIEILVDVLDDVERALEAGPSPDVEKGLELLSRTVQDELEQVGVETIAPESGQRFDPSRHEAVIVEETSEQDPETVIEVLGPGYELEDRQIRAALVKVASAPEADEASS